MLSEVREGGVWGEGVCLVESPLRLRIVSLRFSIIVYRQATPPSLRECGVFVVHVVV